LLRARSPRDPVPLQDERVRRQSEPWRWKPPSSTFLSMMCVVYIRGLASAGSLVPVLTMGAAAAQASLPGAGRGTGHRGGGSLKKRLLLIAVSEVWVRATCAIGATAVQLAPATPLRRRGVGTSHMRQPQRTSAPTRCGYEPHALAGRARVHHRLAQQRAGVGHRRPHGGRHRRRAAA
jgi:hypothetical protein